MSVALLACLMSGGCGAELRKSVDDVIDESTQPKNLSKITASAHDLADAIVQGAFAGGPATTALGQKLQPLIDQLVKATLQAASQGLDSDLSPALDRAVHNAVEAALTSALNDGTRHQLEELEHTLIAAAVGGLANGIRQQVGPAVADAITHQLGPALQHAINDNLGPALALTINQQLTPALANAAQTTAKAAGEGLVDGVRVRAEPLLQQLQDQLRADLAQVKQDSHSILGTVVISVLAVLLGLAIAIALWRHRVATSATSALELVTREIGRMRGEPKIQQLAGEIKREGANTRGGLYLTQHLRAHPNNKVAPPEPPKRTG